MKISAAKARVHEVTITLNREEAYLLMTVFGSLSIGDIERILYSRLGSKPSPLYLPEYLEKNNPPNKADLFKAVNTLDLYFGLQDALGVEKDA